MTTEPDQADWAREHRACFQVGPLVEMKGSERVQIGYTIDLYAALPRDKEPGAARAEAAQRIWERLRAVAEGLIPPDNAKARLEVEPARFAAYFRPENDMAPEVGLRARVFHGADYFAELTADERARQGAIEHMLSAQGLRAGHW
jgi:hypothetical protein